MADEKPKRFDPRKGEGRLLSNMTGEPEIEKKFKVVKYEEYDFKKSLWHRLSQKANDKLGQSVQGYRFDGNKKIPHIGFSADIDYLDEFVLDLANIVKDEMVSAQMDVEKMKDNVLKDKS